MLTKHLIAFCYILLANKVSGRLLNRYKAGVVEYHYNIDSNLTPKDILNDNLKKYIEITEAFAKTWPDVTEGILVFPECGLISLSSENYISVEVPEPDYVNNSFTGLLAIDDLSSAAKANNIWLVVNLVEKYGNKSYNTDVVFRGNGTIAAKYRKYNLFGEPVDKPDEAVPVSFTTSFNVTFGIFTCFDILYSHPALDLVHKGIKHFVFPTDWFSELPFLTAVQYQKSWSWTNDVTLLASGFGNSSMGNSGSGIYIKRTGNDLVFQTDDSRDTKVLMAILDSVDDEIIYDTGKLNLIDVPSSTVPGLLLKREPLNAYTTEKILPNDCKPLSDVKEGTTVNCTTQVTHSLCNHEFCCNFSLTAVFNIYICTTEGCKDAEIHRQTNVAQDDFSRSIHRIAAFNGVRSFDVTTGGLQTCAVVSCRDDSISSCGLAPAVRDLECFTLEYSGDNACVLNRYITQGTIEGQFILNNTFVTPNILLRGSDPSVYMGNVSNNFQMISDGKGYYKLSFSLLPDDVLGTVAIWSRVFDRDGKAVTGASSSPALSYLTILTSAILIYPTLKFLKRD